MVAAAIIALGIALLAAMVTYGVLDSPTRILVYRVVNPDTLLVETISGPGASVRVTDVVETPVAITVTIRSLYVRIGAGSDVGYPYESVVKLHGPIGDRVVIDASNGERVPRAIGPP